MITRIFKTSIPENLHAEFEEKFKEISIPLVESFAGLHSVSIARPTKWNPNEFLMISVWETEADIKNFAGEKWNQAHIPDSMEKYIKECSVEHYENIEL